MGDSVRGEPGDSIESPEGVAGNCEGGCIESARLALDALDLALVEDLIDAASDLSVPPETVSIWDNDVLGLSVFMLPGILDRIDPRSERADSFVSDLLKDGSA